MSDIVQRRLPSGQIVNVSSSAGQVPSVRETGFLPKYDFETIETCLWEIAVCGDNVRKAHGQLVEHFKATDPDFEVPSVHTMRDWVRGKHRNRYHEIRQGKARELEEMLAQKAMSQAAAEHDVQGEALKVVSARLAEANGVEASMILRNISTAKASNIDKAQALRGRSPAQAGARSLGQIADALRRLGAPILEGEGEEIPPEADVVG